MSQLAWDFMEPQSSDRYPILEIYIAPHLKHGTNSAYQTNACRCIKCTLYEARRTQKKYKRFIEYKAGPCMDCNGIFPPEAMEFDHRPGVVKCYNPSSMRGMSSARIEKELAKCDLVCANCHNIRTRKRRIEKQVALYGEQP